MLDKLEHRLRLKSVKSDRPEDEAAPKRLKRNGHKREAHTLSMSRPSKKPTPQVDDESRHVVQTSFKGVDDNDGSHKGSEKHPPLPAPSPTPSRGDDHPDAVARTITEMNRHPLLSVLSALPAHQLHPRAEVRTMNWWRDAHIPRPQARPRARHRRIELADARKP